MIRIYDLVLCSFRFWVLRKFSKPLLFLRKFDFLRSFDTISITIYARPSKLEYLTTQRTLANVNHTRHTVVRDSILSYRYWNTVCKRTVKLTLKGIPKRFFLIVSSYMSVVLSVSDFFCLCWFISPEATQRDLVLVWGFLSYLIFGTI